jgi:hypothetical protein
MAKYIDNIAFNTQLRDYLISCNEAEVNGDEIPEVPHIIGDSFIKIATGLGSTFRFSKYTYLDDMIGDAVSSCFIKIRNFDYTKYDNPFAYFTQICWFAFIGRIGDEHKQKKIIYRVCENLSLEEFNLDSEDADTSNQYLEFLRENIEQRELDKIRQSETEKKFVHRMITKQKSKPVEKVVANSLVFED